MTDSSDISQAEKHDTKSSLQNDDKKNVVLAALSQNTKKNVMT
jgi:hypothetical protein